ncbi:hypothetical protein ILUMI_07020 [Ignelater luminosus]|uniref:Serpin domain-containing protein n=1 Tax=Ignelater luminosus TaxID=2038154 RepID=A0A8K0GIG3_IGNLU|nr:hypothetical protein ILUMI_07020 [Ignelater luminosus]
MKFLLIFTFGILSTLAEGPSLLQEFSTGNNRFADSVYKQLLKSTSGNILICPISAEIILALARIGAKGRTAQQLSSGLHLPNDSDKIEEMITTLIDYLGSGEAYTLKGVNKMYVDESFAINEQFKNVAIDIFDADIENVDFSHGSKAVSKINKWVEDKTENNIKDLLKASDVHSSTCALLVNALFFRARWALSFKKRHTEKKPFYNNFDDSVDVDMMRLNEHFDYYESSDLNAKFLKLKYHGFDASMTIVLPNNQESLGAIEDNINKIFTAPRFKKTYVKVTIPKFKLKTNYKLKQVLLALGIRDAFESSADFSDIGSDTTQQHLKIDEVIQNNLIEVDEHGTTAVSAAEENLGLEHPPPNTATFIADHPFVFYIKKGNIVLFVGAIKELP